MPAQPHIDRAIAEIAGRQHGVVARWQLLGAGVTKHQIGERLRSGRLHQLHRGVYLVGHEIPPRYAREMAALLAFRRTAILSHRTAASLWLLLPYPAPGEIYVTIAPERSTSRPGIEVHRARIEAKHIRHRHGLDLTSPPRTVLDLAARLDELELEQLVAEAHYRNLAREPELRTQLERTPRKRGSQALKAVLDLPGGPQRTRSPAELELLALLRRARITGFRTNARVHGYEVDFLWRDRTFAVEVDGYDAHSGRAAFRARPFENRDPERHGITVMPVTGRQVRADARGVIARLRAALG
jgi:very-short-patch-repair endonuclease